MYRSILNVLDLNLHSLHTPILQIPVLLKIQATADLQHIERRLSAPRPCF